jgi:hypothetical protein
MKTQNELFITFLNENIDELKDVLVDTFELDEDSVNDIVEFDGNNYDGYYGVDKEGECVTFGCDIFESLDDDFEEDNDDDVSIGTDVIGGKEIYFVCYDF